ncbi:hypothetical protein CHLRE_12g550468v5 [Chlamydomonas reinhardtii]|uniref:Uncharacterized protein n=1 Tax=Chlamydomonas reinhardtii TaxID=3055 RepID=A0A2K3D674_CHLRE|nr:uncharacterized protein CHLRE_12g550468v5 [Chlamydomonas reinhardtii]PNW76032.1 hypothetical protein CHLRE_12g550468v5 [Chlamydomonas reinhardtii]
MTATGFDGGKSAHRKALPAGAGALSRSWRLGRPRLTARRPGGEAVPLLQQFYHLGITSRNSTLRWFKGAFEEGPDGSAAAAPAPLSVLDAARTSLDAETSPHPAPPHPTLAPHPRH